MEMEGELVAHNPVRFDGKFRGRISCGETFHIESNGVVVGETEAVNVVINGLLHGDLVARKRLEIRPGGTFYGELIVQPEVLVLAETAQFGREQPQPETKGKVVQIPAAPAEHTEKNL